MNELLSGVKNMYVDTSTYVRAKRGESERFRKDSGARQGCIMSPWLFMMEVKMEMGRMGESGDYMASCIQMTWFCVVSQRRTGGQWWDGLLRCEED